MKKLIAIIINGKPQVGKDSFVNCVSEIVEESTNLKVLNISTISVIKDAAKLLGWDGVKTPEARKFLSDLKDLSTNYNDFPAKHIVDIVNKRRAQSSNEYFKFIFIHCREPEEINKIKECIGSDVYTLLIRRDVEDVTTNHADMQTEFYNYDFIIDNNSTIEDLKEKAAKFIKRIDK